MKLYTIFVSILLQFATQLTSSERLHKQIYSSIEGGAACFRRLNGTHQAGCSSSEKGDVGVVHMIYNVQDAQWLVNNATAGPYMAVVSTTLFHYIIEVLMENPQNVAGVLLFHNASIGVRAFTHESRCPNEYVSGPGSQCSSSDAGGIVWNDPGTALIRRDIPFPIFYLPDSRDEEIYKIENCFTRFNSDLNNQEDMPLCSLQMSTFMYAAVNSVICMRRSSSTALLTANKVCDPLGDNNVYYSLFPRKTKTEKSVNLVTARIDTASLFDGMAPGAASSVVGMVTLITAAATLSDMIPIKDMELYKSNVLWTLFNGEAFDYIGSQRVAYDISRGAWPPDSPLTPDDVKLHVELGQLGGSLKLHNKDFTWPLYAFAPTEEASKLTEFLEIMNKNTAPLSITLTPKFTSNLPPSSLHSFRRILKNVTQSGELPEVVLVDHDETFTNKYYHSVLDDDENIGFDYHNISIGKDGVFISTEDLLAKGTMSAREAQVKIAHLATAVAKTLYQQVTLQEYEGDITASAHLVDEMLYCFLKSQACRLLIAADYMQSSASEEALPARALPLYVGVATWPSPPAVFAGHLLALLTGSHLDLTRTECNNKKDIDYSYYYLKGWNHSGICIETTMNFSQAISPAFTITDYDLESGLYSSWTESVWQAMWVRLFVASGGLGARMAFIFGLVFTLLAALITLWLKKHAHIVFPQCHATVNRDGGAGILRTVNC